MSDTKPPRTMKTIQEEFLNPTDLQNYSDGRMLDEFINLLRSKFDFSNNEYSHKLIVNTIIDRHCVGDDCIDYFYCVTERPETDEEYENRIEKLRLLQIEKEKKLEEKRINDEILKQAKEKIDQQYIKNAIEHNFNDTLNQLYEHFTREEIKELMKRVPSRSFIGRKSNKKEV